MTEAKIETKVHPPEAELADFLGNSLSAEERERLEEHIAGCDECLERVVSSYEAVSESGNGASHRKGKAGFMKKINLCLVLAVISFGLSFVIPRYFIQLLVATLLLGIKWIVDSKTTRMLVMIYEAWRKGGEKEASRILGTFDSQSKGRF